MYGLGQLCRVMYALGHFWVTLFNFCTLLAKSLKNMILWFRVDDDFFFQKTSETPKPFTLPYV